jgi:UDP-glucose-4-epimerase GalE
VTVLVTGGAGYIGSITARALAASGRRVVVLDTLERGRREAVGDAPFVRGDVADRDLVRRVCAEHGVDEVVHFAAYKSVAESMAEPARYFANNTAGSLLLLEALAEAGVDRFVFSSTASVYGTPERVPVREDDPVRCESVYAETKNLVERALGWMSDRGSLRHVSLRYFNAAGAADDASLGEDWDVSSNLVPVVMKVTAGLSPELGIFGGEHPTPDGTCVRDYIHVEDLAAAHVAALDHLAAGGTSEVLNVGTGTGTSVLEILAATERVTGRPVPRRILAPRPGDPPVSVADTSRIGRVLDWTPQRFLDDILSSAWRWHSSRT